MHEKQRELDEQELAYNRLHFRQVLWKSILWPVVPAGIHIAFRLIAPELFKAYWQYTLGVLIFGAIVSCYVWITQNRCLSVTRDSEENSLREVVPTVPDAVHGSCRRQSTLRLTVGADAPAT